MTVSVKIDTKQLERDVKRLSDKMRKQVPFATALAITRTAQALKKDLTKELEQTFDSPSRYITRGTFNTSAKKSDLSAIVGMRDKATRGASPAQYVKESFGGGARGLKPYELALKGMGALPSGMRAVPGDDLRLDSGGNPNRKELAEIFGALRSRMNVNKGRGRRAHTVGYFIVRPGATDPRVRHLRPGIWRRRMTYATGGYNDRPPIAVFIFVKQATYQKVINLPALAAKTINREFYKQFNAALQSAIATTR